MAEGRHQQESAQADLSPKVIPYLAPGFNPGEMGLPGPGLDTHCEKRYNLANGRFEEHE